MAKAATKKAPKAKGAKPAPKAAAKAEARKSKVFVARTGDVIEVDFVQGMTVEQAISRAGFTLSSVNEVRINNVRASSNKQVLKENDQVTLLGRIAGG